MNCDLGRCAHHLVIFTHVGGAKVNENVNDEHNIDYQVNNDCNGKNKEKTRQITLRAHTYTMFKLKETVR